MENFKKPVLIFLIAFWGFLTRAQELQTNISVHDPVIIKQDNTFYIFGTGRGIALWSSQDLKYWKKEQQIFNTPPPWTQKAVSGFKDYFWAPDISFFKGKYYLYYSISTFGKNTSAIGLATNKTLNPSNKNYKWEDRGMIMQSLPGINNWNAIDPNLVADKRGRLFLVFGSFWEGLKLIKLSRNGTHVNQGLEKLPTLASRGTEPNAIEAPFIFRKNNFYYLFASIDYCCKGESSTYKMIVGRSKKIEGPYLDKTGTTLATGGGSILLEGDKKWYGVGHCAVYNSGNSDYLIFHGYDASDKGKPKLRIEKLRWNKEKWPEVAPY